MVKELWGVYVSGTDNLVQVEVSRKRARDLSWQLEMTTKGDYSVRQITVLDGWGWEVEP